MRVLSGLAKGELYKSIQLSMNNMESVLAKTPSRV